METKKQVFALFRSIQIIMAFAYSLLIVCVVLIVFFISFQVTERALRQNSEEYAAQIVKQVAYNITTYLDSMTSLSAFLLSNPDIQEYFFSNAKNSQTARKIQRTLYSVLIHRKDLSLVALLGKQNAALFHDEGYRLNPAVVPTKQKWYQAALKAQGDPVFSAPHVQNIVKDRYLWVVSLSRVIGFSERKEPAGVLLIDLNYHLIEDLCTKVSLGKRGYVFIVDREGNLIYHPHQQILYSNLRKEYIQEVLESKEGAFTVEDAQGERQYTVGNIEIADWKVVGVHYLDELGLDRARLSRIYILWGVIFLYITLLFSILLSLQISRPIKRLRDTIKAVELGNFDIQVNVQSSTEIGELARDFNIMVQKIKELIELNIQEQQNKRKSELKALQAQINPHFLYNTLDSIIWMAEDKKEQQVITMVAALAKLFRLSISKGKEIITVGEEVEHVRQYLIIQKIRYQDKLDYAIQVPKEIYPYKTVKIILQPLVENAIYHGIKNNPQAGRIVISGYKEDDHIVLQVQDNGVGIPSTILTSILNPKNPVDTLHKSGIGVRNVDERIKLYFGKEYGLHFQSVEGEGTVVSIRLPAVLVEEST